MEKVDIIMSTKQMNVHYIYITYVRKTNIEVAQPTFQRRINVVSTLWINVEITLILR